MRSIYLHFPFCESKCHYCDFYSIGVERTGDQDPALFERALKREIELRIAAGVIREPIETLFMGGGTPSMTPPDSMRRALEPLLQTITLAPGYEWTMEANPSSVDLDRLKAYRDLGVNRISMGVQAMRDDLLLRLGRVHSRDAALRALDTIFAAGYTQASVDLLCGVPGQSVADVESAMEQLTAYPITHLSCYLLTLPKTHKMYRELPDEDAQLEHLLTIDRFMTGKGFDHYEISNFARPGGQARHNLAYWKGHGYLAFGPSAHGFDHARGVREKNVSSLHKYARMLLEENRLPIEWEETLTPEQKEIEKWMLALRLAEGFPSHWLDTPKRQAVAKNLRQEGLLTDAHSATPELRLRLTPRGFALSDQVAQLLV